MLYLGADRLITKLFLYRGGLERGQGQYYAQKFIYPQTLLLLLNLGDVYQQNTITSKTPYLPTASILNINNRIFAPFLFPTLDTKIIKSLNFVSRNEIFSNIWYIKLEYFCTLHSQTTLKTKLKCKSTSQFFIKHVTWPYFVTLYMKDKVKLIEAKENTFTIYKV